MQISLIGKKPINSADQPIPNPLAQKLVELGMDPDSVTATVLAIWPVVNDQLCQKVVLALGHKYDFGAIDQVAAERGFDEDRQAMLYEQVYKQETGSDFSQELQNIYQLFADRIAEFPQRFAELSAKVAEMEESSEDQINQQIADYVSNLVSDGSSK